MYYMEVKIPNFSILYQVCQEKMYKYTYHMIGGSGYNILTIWLVGAVIIYLPYDWWERL